MTIYICQAWLCDEVYNFHIFIIFWRAQQQTELAKLLQDEKVLFNEEAKELEKNLNDLKHQKVCSERIAMCCIYYFEISPFIYKKTSSNFVW